MHCSFCGKPKAEVTLLIELKAGSNPNVTADVRICDECIGLCNELAYRRLYELGRELHLMGKSSHAVDHIEPKED